MKPLPEIPAHLSDYGVKTVSIRRDNRDVELTLRLKAGKVNVYPRKDLSAKKHKTQGLCFAVACRKTLLHLKVRSLECGKASI